MAIKELLAEELENSLRMERDYLRKVADLPHGSLVIKIISGRPYYYLASREEGRVRFKYQGRDMSESDVAKYKAAKEYRVKYRKLLKDVRMQIKFMRKALRAKQAV
ncbi:MAG: hypothetical protein WCI03_14975 [bacterium]|jgi:hypothetical protein